MKQTKFPRFSNPRYKGAPVKTDDDDDDYEIESGEAENADCCVNKKWYWWTPRPNSLPVAFSRDTSIHGLHFLGQEKRHISERIFWLIGFLMSLGLAVYLINAIYSNYQNVPVIVSFQTSEIDTDLIPFPAVTVCNMNQFPKRKVEEIEKIADDPNHKDNLKAKKELEFVQNACNAQQSFAKKHHYAHKRGSHDHEAEGANATELTAKDLIEMTDFLMRNTMPCNELLRLCMLGERKYRCESLFTPFISDYGKCCVFNILPLPLLLQNPANKGKDNDSLIYNNAVLGSDARKNWPENEIEKWRKWNYEDGIFLERHSQKPWRQKRAGLPYGLSFLIDPNTDDYYCPAGDSIGIRYIMHSPLEMPHVMEFASVAHLNREILVEVHPDVTNADRDIRYIDKEKRQCYFGREKSLRFFAPYTGGNCIDECTATLLTRRCNCTLFYMPRDDGVRICDSDPESEDFKCTEAAELDLQEHIHEECGECDPLCEDIAYNYETTIATMQNFTKLWGNPKNSSSVPDWAAHKMAIMHIFFGAETTVPKFRKRLYGTTDLVGDMGAILGLCLGFSILSGVEFVYFLTLRAFWTFCRKRHRKNHQCSQQDHKNTNNFLQQLLFQKQRTKVIQLDPTVIPVYPNETPLKHGNRQQAAPAWGNAQGHHFYGAKSFRLLQGHGNNYGASGGYNYY